MPLASRQRPQESTRSPLRWYRSSVASLLDSDPWETAANAAVSSPYEYAVQFNKDLILFAKTHQGIVPGSALLTPRTAVASVSNSLTNTAANIRTPLNTDKGFVVLNGATLTPTVAGAGNAKTGTIELILAMV